MAAPAALCSPHSFSIVHCSGMLVLPRQVHHLGHLGLGDLVGEHAAHPDAAAMHVQHDAGRLLARLLEEPLQHVHDELHRRVVVVQHQHLVHGGLLGLRPWLDDHVGAGVRPLGPTPLVVVAHIQIPLPVARGPAAHTSVGSLSSQHIENFTRCERRKFNMPAGTCAVAGGGAAISREAAATSPRRQQAEAENKKPRSTRGLLSRRHRAAAVGRRAARRRLRAATGSASRR